MCWTMSYIVGCCVLLYGGVCHSYLLCLVACVTCVQLKRKHTHLFVIYHVFLFVYILYLAVCILGSHSYDVCVHIVMFKYLYS